MVTQKKKIYNLSAEGKSPSSIKKSQFEFLNFSTLSNAITIIIM